MAWHLEKFWYVKNFQTSTSNLFMIQTPNRKVFNMKVIPLDLTFPKIWNSFILDKKCIGCAWHKQGDITWQGSSFKHQCTIALQSKLNSDHPIFICGPQAMISWACARPCTLASPFAKIGKWIRVWNYQPFQLYIELQLLRNEHTFAPALIPYLKPSLWKG